ncbi:hypothetical protein BSL78_00494 [Apostichopus japonicus]|uniref:C-type lectin domain-containing protein n=1 Tax=Stichopus japonicus TaxID=307972 RepID=A0A2G8LQR1_STIJA|nr:hypothetical protein BSL78_00494 [Apostichopus japonicus]
MQPSPYILLDRCRAHDNWPGMNLYGDTDEPIVHWYEDEVTVYAGVTEAVLVLAVTQPSENDITVSLRGFGVGVSLVGDIVIPETATVKAGRRHTEVVVFSRPKLVKRSYCWREQIGCHSASFQASRMSVPEDAGTIYIPFLVNRPFSKDFEIGYKVDLRWFGAIHHAEHEADYHYHVTHNHQGDNKHVILRAGETSVKIPITIIDDSKAEETEQFIVRLDHKCLSPFMNVLSDYVIVDIEDNDVCTDIPPGPYEYYNEHCYFLVENPNGVTFLDTAVGCVQYGGEVATLSNAIENSIVYQLLTDGETAWIGAERDPQNPNAFLWSDGTPVEFQSWGTGEPDSTETGKDCVFIRHHNQTVEWISDYCNDVSNVSYDLCEKIANAKC